MNYSFTPHRQGRSRAHFYLANKLFLFIIMAKKKMRIASSSKAWSEASCIFLSRKNGQGGLHAEQRKEATLQAFC